MKKFRIFAILALILVSSSLLMFACGDKGNAQDTYENFHTTITKFEDNKMLFSTETTKNRVTLEFYLNNFKKKNSYGSEVQDDMNYIYLTSTGLSFIKNNYGKLDGLEGDYDFSRLNQTLTNLNEGYNNLKQENENLNNVEASTNVNVYNGYFARYKTFAKEFISEVYSSALALGDFLANDVKIIESLGTEEQTEEALQFYYEYQTLLLLNDCKILIMDSAAGEVVTNMVYSNAVNRLTTILNYKDKKVKNLSVEQVNKYLDVSSAVDNQRRLYKDSINNFSIYELVNTYKGSLDEYVKVKENAEAYYKQLELYVEIMNLYIGYENSNVINRY